MEKIDKQDKIGKLGRTGYEANENIEANFDSLFRLLE